MMNIDEAFEMARARQEHLRALASPQPLFPITDPNADPIRQRMGRTLVRFGLWLDDHCPDMLPEPEITTT